LTGQAGTGSLGALGYAFNKGLTGQTGLGSQGNITYEFSNALIGIQATGSQGAITFSSAGIDFTGTLTGIQGTGSQGAISFDNGTAQTLTDTHDGYWRKQWLKKKKKPFEPQTIDEVVEFVNEQVQELQEKPKKLVKDKQLYDFHALFEIQNRIQLAEQLMAKYQQESDEEDELMALIGMI
jgi:hypothetical protein